jgi:hypothetical protein
VSWVPLTSVSGDGRHPILAAGPFFHCGHILVFCLICGTVAGLVGALTVKKLTFVVVQALPSAAAPAYIVLA